uniref:Uncharacterized protein n=1 Tax=Cacopsylla melanoneura TaxID=428564 RepID=A0A8D8UHZ0_9HEMI
MPVISGCIIITHKKIGFHHYLLTHCHQFPTANQRSVSVKLSMRQYQIEYKAGRTVIKHHTPSDNGSSQAFFYWLILKYFFRGFSTNFPFLIMIPLSEKIMEIQ